MLVSLKARGHASTWLGSLSLGGLKDKHLAFGHLVISRCFVAYWYCMLVLLVVFADFIDLSSTDVRILVLSEVNQPMEKILYSALS